MSAYVRPVREPRLRGDALQLRKRGREDVVVDFGQCATLADQEAIARVWAYAVGNVDAPKPNGHYRLAVPADRFDENCRGIPATRTRAVDPLWRLVQQAGGPTPVESLAQVRERKEAARIEWRRKAEDVALRGLAAIVAMEELEDPVEAGELALVRARALVVGERWAGTHALQVSAVQDLVERTASEPPEPEPPHPESDREPEPTNREPRPEPKRPGPERPPPEPSVRNARTQPLSREPEPPQKPGPARPPASSWSTAPSSFGSDTS